MTADLGVKNPQLAQDIRDWFSRHQDGKPFSEGLERLYTELGALEILAQDGKVDLTKIQVEGGIVKVVKDRFATPAQKQTSAITGARTATTTLSRIHATPV